MTAVTGIRILRVKTTGMEENKKKEQLTIVDVSDSGPLKVTGNFILKDLKRDRMESPEEVLLCMCGNSRSKPFCDCSHKK